MGDPGDPGDPGVTVAIGAGIVGILGGRHPSPRKASTLMVKYYSTTSLVAALLIIPVHVIRVLAV